MTMKFPISPWLFLVLLRPVVSAEANEATIGTLSSGQAQQTATTTVKAAAVTPASSSAPSSLKTSLTKIFLTTGAARPLSTTSTTTTPQWTVTATTAGSVQSDNCTKPVPVANQFDTPGLSGWVLTSHSDYFNNSASEHGHNMNCRWRIQKEVGLILAIRVSSLLLESAPTCEFDSLVFEYVELDSNLEVSRNFCGSADNRVLLAVSDVNITFKSDSSVSYRGFHLQWAFVNASLAADIQNSSRSSLCTKLQEVPDATMFGITAPGGRLVSHDDFAISPALTSSSFEISPTLMHSAQYLNNQNCLWTISLVKQYILLWIRFLQLESPDSVLRCNYDNLTLQFTEAATDQRVTRTMCTLTRNLVFLAHSNVDLAFRTDSSVGSRGFDLEWLHLNASQARIVQRSLVSFAANSTQSGCTTPESVSNLTLDQVGAFPGGQLLSHPEYLTILSSHYRPDMNCQWTIKNPNNLTLIHFKVVSLDLETSSVRSLVCRFDNLTVEYRDALTNRWVSKVACSSLHLAYFTSSSDVTVKFVTDRSVSRRGFHLMWFFVPQRYAFRLPGLESMQSFNCPKINESEGTLQVDSYLQNINCRWSWTVNEGQIMNVSIVYGDPEDQEGMQLFNEASSGLCCHSGSPQLRLTFADAGGRFKQYCFCGSRATVLAVSIYQGMFNLAFRSEAAAQIRGFRLHYKRLEEPVHKNCAELQVLSRYQSKLQDRMSRSQKSRCEWTVQPLDENHGVRVTVNRLTLLEQRFIPGALGHHSLAVPMMDCSCRLDMTTNSSISYETLRSWTLMIHSKASSIDSSAIAPNRQSSCCGNSRPYMYNQHGVSIKEMTSLGPVSIKIDFDRQPSRSFLVYDIDIRHFPLAKPGSSKLCAGQQAVTTKHSVIEQHPEGRLVSVKQFTLTSGVDCLTGILLDTSQAMAAVTLQNSYILRVSVNCTQSGGHFSVVNDILSDTVVNCSAGIASGPLLQRLPVILEAVGTGGFTAVVEKVQLIFDAGPLCQRFTPTSLPWRAYMPLYSPLFEGFSARSMIYCTIELTPPPEHELIVQLQMPFNNDYQEQFCTEISLLHNQPKLSFITSDLHSGSVTRLSLCDHNAPGGLQLQDRVRVGAGESLTVDLTIAHMDAQASQVTEGLSGLLQGTGVDALIIVDQVQVCERFPSSAGLWQLSADGTELVKSVTVDPGSTQTDCKLQLDAVTAVGIANQSKALVPNAAKVGCWILRVAFDKFSTTCGLKLLMLTVSHWDDLTASVEHNQHEICGSSAIRFSMHASLLAVGSGLSVSYSGVRSGFQARFSISACPVSELTAQLKDAPVATGSVAPSLTAVLVILALGNVLAVLFAFRARIVHGIQLFVSRVQRSQQLVYRSDGDAVNLIHEDT